ncbi:condensation domain-containing protein [Gordonia aurantiaca]|uniref:condensation protein n=1 Tax=Gordonia sp. B21 TaxID=3151852 RepID=UPI003263517E
MKLSSSESWEVAGGELVRWRPVPGGFAEEASAPVSENERFHLTSLSAGQPGWMALTLDFPQRLDPDLLGDVVGSVITRHDALRSHYVRTPEGGFARLLHATADVKEEVREDRTGLGAREFATRLADDIGETCDPFQPMPHYLAAVLRPSSTTLICGFDHCYVDARSLAVVANEICELIHGRALPAAPSGLEAVRKVAAAEACVPADDPRVAEWEGFLSATGWRVPEFPLDLGVDPGATYPVKTMVRTLLPASEAARFSSTVHRAGARTYPALLTCAAKAISAAGGPEDVATVVPTGTGAGPGVVCWSVGNAPMIIRSTGDLDAAMHANTDRLAAALPLAEIGLTPVYTAFGDRLRPSRHDVFMMSYVDYTRMPTPACDVAVRQVSSQKPTDTAQWWLWRDHDGIHVRVRYPDTERAARVLSGVLDEMAALAGSVIGVTGCTGTA